MARVAVSRDRRGAALVVVVLALLAMGGLAHGMLLAARTEAAAAGAGADQLALRGASEGALVRAWSVPAGPWMDSVAPWGARPVVLERFGPFDAAGTYRRVGRESWLLEAGADRVRFSGAGGSDAPAGSGPDVSAGGFSSPTTRTSALVWRMDPVARAAVLAAVLQVDTGAVVVVDGPVIGTGYTDVGVPPIGPAGCARWAAPLDSLAPPYLPATAAAALAAEGPRLGLLPFDTLLARAGAPLSGAGRPAPVETLGRCESGAAWNWGDPDRPSAPCGGHVALRAARGPLRVEGGAGQGLLLVDGDLTLDAGARYYGLILATGALRIGEGSELVGAAVAAGGVHVAAGGGARGSACTVARALDAHRVALGRAVLLEGPAVGPF